MRNPFISAIICFIAITFSQINVHASEQSQKQSPSLEQMVGQMIMVGFRGLDDPEDDDMPDVLAGIRKGQIGGVILFNYDVMRRSWTRNVRSLEQVKKLTHMLQKESSIPLFIGIDQEGGNVRRLRPEHGTKFDLPSAENMAKGTVNETRTWGEKTGELLHSLGININFAPSVDVNINPESPVIGKWKRSFSADENQVILHAKAFAEGLAKHGIISTYKHFPGHGSSLTDTHAGLTDITKTWQERELVPYMPQNRPDVPLIIMTGHLFHKKFDPNHPSTISKNIITTLLREDLAWDGVVVSDDIQMRALRSHYSRKEALHLAILAGVDILLIGNNPHWQNKLGQNMHREVMELLAEKKVSPERIKKSYTRIMQLKEKVGLVSADSW